MLHGQPRAAAELAGRTHVGMGCGPLRVISSPRYPKHSKPTVPSKATSAYRLYPHPGHKPAWHLYHQRDVRLGKLGALPRNLDLCCPVACPIVPAVLKAGIGAISQADAWHHIGAPALSYPMYLAHCLLPVLVGKATRCAADISGAARLPTIHHWTRKTKQHAQWQIRHSNLGSRSC